MLITWERHRSGPPVCRISHAFRQYEAAKAEAISAYLGRVCFRDSREPRSLDVVLETLFASRVRGFNGQEISVRDGVLDAQAASPGQAIAAIEPVERFLVLFRGAMPGDEAFRAELARIGINTDLTAPEIPNPILDAAIEAGLDLIPKDRGSGCYEIRSRSGRRMTVMKALTERTARIAVNITNSKLWTTEILGLAGLPVPQSRLVQSQAEALRLSRAVAPRAIVLKPLNTDFGVAVSTGLRSESEVAEAFRIASQYGHVLAQEHIDGDDYRILVIDGDVAGVKRRVAFSVVGDGARTIRDLAAEKIRQRAADPFYRDFNLIDLDGPEIAATLARQGLRLEITPDAGKQVRLRDNANISSGGEHVFVTDICHPDNTELAIEAANVVGLDVAGIDLISPDITRSWKETGAAICEINATPSISFPGAAQMVLRRLTDPVEASEGTQGDVLYISRDRKVKRVQRADDPRPFLDLDSLSDRHVQLQAYLFRTTGNVALGLSIERFLALGCPNRNVTRAVIGRTCIDTDKTLDEVARRLLPDCEIVVEDD